MPQPDRYASDILGRLFGGRGPVRPVRRPGALGGGSLGWFAVPSAARARVLVPVGRPDAAVMLTRHGAGARRLGRAVAATAVRTGAAGLLPLPRLHLGPVSPAGGAHLEDLLRDHLGDGLAVGVLLGPPRPNRKPVLQVFGPDGRTLAFVKVGTDATTSALVAREARNLARVAAAGLELVEPPEVVHAGPVGDLQVLVLRPLASSQQQGRGPRPEPPVAAMAEVAGCAGSRSGPLADSTYWAGVVAAAAEVRDPAGRRAVGSVVARTADRHGGAVVGLGSWHGDWAPWNMGQAGGRVQVWDWERYDEDVVWGMDLVHFLCQRVRHGSRAQAEQEDEVRGRLPVLLARAGGPAPAQDADVVLLCYLLTLGLRFADRPGSVGGLHPRAAWALDLAGRVLQGRGSRA